MNKYLLLAVSIMALGLTLPAVAMDDAPVDADHVEHCVDENGEEVECVVEDTVSEDEAVEVEAGAEAEVDVDAEAEADMDSEAEHDAEHY